MIEFPCEHCDTVLSIAPDQLGSELFCPACDKEITLPELSPEMEVKLTIAMAQAKNLPKDDLDTKKAKRMLEEPDSKETVVWKERLAASFQAVTFQTLPEDHVEEKEEEKEEKGIKKVFGIFKK